MRPRLLRADNFTPATRTPWGGRRILDHYKRGLLPDTERDTAALPRCGESWEISVEPSFPSRFADDDTFLRDAIADAPAKWLGPAAMSRGLRQTPLLVKLVDAGSQLSVQVHPALDDPQLADHESGKVEILYVLDTATDDAGIHLGFRDGVSRRDVQECLRANAPLDPLMNFVPVTRGDAFTIEAGTVHAIGAGVTLFEPQWVSPGRCGLTYRFWDWNRLYDHHGVLSPDGDPRTLHVDRALEVTDWDGPRGDQLLARCRVTLDRRAEHEFAGDTAMRRQPVTTSSRFALERWSGVGDLEIPAMETLLAAVCVSGSGALRTAAGSLSIRRGQSAVIPASAGDMTITGHPESQLDGPEHGLTGTSIEPGIELMVTRATV